VRDRVVHPNATDAIQFANKLQALQHRASSKNVMEDALRDDDTFKGELLEDGEM
jgi:hypothetical protein